MLASFLAVIGVLALVAGGRLISISVKGRGWPVTSGHVIEKSVGPSSTTGASRAGHYFEPRVKYTYTVAGKNYIGTRIRSVTAAYDKSHAERIVNDMPESVRVHYNPRDPGDAYLQPSSVALAAVALLIGVVCLAIGAGLFYARKG
jgi:hypothetical protein